MLSLHGRDRCCKNISAAVSPQPPQTHDTVALLQQKSHREGQILAFLPRCGNVYVSQHVSVQLSVSLCVFVSCRYSRRDSGSVPGVCLESGCGLCELWCSLTAAFSWKASLWGPAGFQYAHLHIKTAQERDSAQRGWGGGGEGLHEKGVQGNEGCFIFCTPPPPPQGWAGV